MFLDIHRHSNNRGKASFMLRNLFHNQTEELASTLYSSVGLHPWHVTSKCLESDISQIEKIANTQNVLAIGECGIDKICKSDLSAQRNAFQLQINIAKAAAKPMLIHCVKAYDELQAYRKNSKHQQAWIFHWYNAAPQTGLDLIDKGCYLSFGHTLFENNSKACKTFVEIPLNRIFLETDDAAVNIEEVYHQAAKLRNIPLTNLQEQIRTNFSDCFGIVL